MTNDEQEPLSEALNFEVTEEDWDAGRAVGATGAEVMEFAIHRALDRMEELPREGRAVKVTPEWITIDLPPGYTLPEYRIAQPFSQE